MINELEHTVHINSEDTCENCGCGPKERLASIVRAAYNE